ncbi:FUSC family protein [Vibrio ulleungensis]|uniref:FUSC family protein n=1 Tax=Vibrio ulleungensis TaxID=2807619 RepID=A0ABS2HHJ9_9VIBR|nr:FUSC family protein [Vibrio ulleungensis]MBM7035307.1 FUSC family protein [Vibrio ulleungensis]
MLNSSTKEAIKVALSIIVALCLAIWFQWEKPYWAAIAVGVMALNETFAHAINKGYNRLIGTLLGTVFAFILISMFSQNPTLFLSIFTLLLAFSIFMSSDEQYGYIFSMAFTVCAIVSCMGQFDGETTFYFAILRFQETMLGVVTYSVIFQLLWPVNTEKGFSQKFTEAVEELIASIHKPQLTEEGVHESIANIEMLRKILNMPLTGSYVLRHHRKHWIQRIAEMRAIYGALQQRLESSEVNWTALLDSLEQFDSKHPQLSLLSEGVGIVANDPSTSWHQEKRTFIQHLHQDYKRVMQGVCMFLASIVIWIYLPVPGGAIFPMLAGILASQLPTLPPTTIRDAAMGVLGTGSVVLLEYVFIMPYFTELWQLALFYFVNTLVIWELFSSPPLMIHRILGINLLVVLTSGALNLTPVYSIEMPLFMMVNILMMLMIAKIFTDIFNPAPHR